jgi:hypothetical protein
MPSAASRFGVFSVSWKSGPYRPRTGGLFDRGDRGPDVVALFCLGHADMDDAATRQPVRDELGATLLAFHDQRRVIVGHRLVERQGRSDPVFVEHVQDAEDADAVAVFVVAVAADIGKLRLVAGPEPLGAAHRAHRNGRPRRHLPIPMLQIDDDYERHPGIVRPSQSRPRDDRRPGIEILVHAVGALGRHPSLPLLPSS